MDRMELWLTTAALSLAVAYGVVCASAPDLSFRLDGTYRRTDGEVGPTAFRNRRIAGWVAIAVGVFGAAWLLSWEGVVAVVIVAAGTSFVLAIR